MRNIFRQRSRWCKGQMQVFFSARCPLLNSGLSLGHRLLYTGACWSYITNTFAVPLAVMVPFLAIVFGILPFNLNRWAAAAAAPEELRSSCLARRCWACIWRAGRSGCSRARGLTGPARLPFFPPCRDFAMAATLYLISNSLINLYCKKRWHIKLMWFGAVSCTLLWFTFTKVSRRGLALPWVIPPRTAASSTLLCAPASW